MRNQKIKGKFRGEFRGRNGSVDSISKVSLENIDIYNSSVSEVEFIQQYNLYELQQNDTQSLIPVSMRAIRIFGEGESYNYYDISNSIITNLEVKDILVDNKGSVGIIEGVIYTTLLGISKANQTKDRVGENATTENQLDAVEQQKEIHNTATDNPPVMNRTEGFSWNRFLINALLFAIILTIIYFIWCLTIGPCKRKCDCEETKQKIATLKQDSIKKQRSDSLSAVKRQDSIRTQYTDSLQAMKSGIVEITLSWSEGDLEGSDDDLDLKLITPKRDTVSYNKPSIGSVDLNVDANSKNDKMFTKPVEHIYIPYDASYDDYKGTYIILIDFYRDRNTNGVTDGYVKYTLTIKNKNKFEKINGIFDKNRTLYIEDKLNNSRDGNSTIIAKYLEL